MTYMIQYTCIYITLKLEFHAEAMFQEDEEDWRDVIDILSGLGIFNFFIHNLYSCSSACYIATMC